MFTVDTKQFTGPLDLLLQLIEEQKFEITDISLAKVTEQFVDRLEAMREGAPDLIPDFLSVATRLVFLKSRALLPYLEPDEEGDDLDKQLKIYKEFLEASKKIAEIITLGNFSFSREKFIAPIEIKFVPPKNVDTNSLAGAFYSVLRKVSPIRNLPKLSIDREVSIQERIMFLRDIVSKQKTIDFHKDFLTAKNKTEVIVNFLAALELLKAQCINAKQNKVFSKIIIQRI
jgi:segregation and condensation protein A